MSTIAERARAEADEAERENPDDETPEVIEPDEDEQAEEAESEPEPPSTEAQIKAQEKALNAESKRHATALAKALGDQWADFAMCPLCQVDGYTIPYQPGEVGPEQREAVAIVLGESGTERLKKHPSKVRCPACDGWGALDTDSRKPEYKEDACLTCNGSGTVDQSMLDSQAANRERDSRVAPVTNLYDPGTVNFDPWGRPPGHPHWGQNPAEVGAVG
jgi:hypothetical protein